MLIKNLLNLDFCGETFAWECVMWSLIEAHSQGLRVPESDSFFPSFPLINVIKKGTILEVV